MGEQLGFTTLPDTKPERGSEGEGADVGPREAGGEKALKDLHTLLLETQVMKGKLVCGNCGHEYAIKEGIANFLLPSHLGEWVVPIEPVAGCKGGVLGVKGELMGG